MKLLFLPMAWAATLSLLAGGCEVLHQSPSQLHIPLVTQNACSADPTPSPQISILARWVLPSQLPIITGAALERVIGGPLEASFPVHDNLTPHPAAVP